MQAYKIEERQNKKGDRIKFLKSPNYNYSFNKNNGMFIRFGTTLNEDPDYSPYGPEIIDMEISTICSKACSWCYKSNTAIGKNMLFPEFEAIFKKLPDTVTQIAFGIGDITGNPDLFKIMQHCRDRGIIPNVTINGDNLTDELAKKLVDVCGAIAVSHYNDDACFNAVKKLSDLGMKQVNIHKLLAHETLSSCHELIEKSTSDDRLKGLNAIVFLWLKPKGERNLLHQVKSMEDYKNLIDHAFNKNIRFGMDSCSACFFLKAIKDRKDFKSLKKMVEPCESTMFSYYINVDGFGLPCSFCENKYQGIDIKKIKNFLKEVWFHIDTSSFRNLNYRSHGKCVAYQLKFGE